MQVGLFRIEVWDHDEAVYREALLNALTHRDYQLRDVVHVHHYPDRLEIMNPGGLPGGITAGNILRHQPKRRNPLLAEALARLGLVERAGVGVDKMYAMMLRYGKEPPEYMTYPDAVSWSLHNPGFDRRFVRFVARKQEEMQTLSLDMLIVLSLLGREGEASRAQLARALQLPEDRTPQAARHDGGARADRLGAGGPGAHQPALGAVTRRTAGPRLPSPGAVSKPPAAAAAASPPKAPTRPRRRGGAETGRPSGGRAQQRPAGGLRPNTQSAWRVLRRLTLAGQLRKVGRGPRSVRYHLSGAAPAKAAGTAEHEFSGTLAAAAFVALRACCRGARLKIGASPSARGRSF